MLVWIPIALSTSMAEYEFNFEQPVLVGQSVGVAVNASCGVGRFWFPQSAATVDSGCQECEAGT